MADNKLRQGTLFPDTPVTYEPTPIDPKTICPKCGKQGMVDRKVGDLTRYRCPYSSCLHGWGDELPPCEHKDFVREVIAGQKTGEYLCVDCRVCFTYDEVCEFRERSARSP